MVVKFEVHGEPVGKGRPKFSKVGGFVKTYTPDKTAIYENLIKVEYQRQCGDFKFEADDQLDVRIIAYHGIPKKLRPIKKPDADNIVKCYLDALNKIAYNDDTQVVDLQIRRFYSYKPRVVVTIRKTNE